MFNKNPRTGSKGIISDIEVPSYQILQVFPQPSLQKTLLTHAYIHTQIMDEYKFMLLQYVEFYYYAYILLIFTLSFVCLAYNATFIFILSFFINKSAFYTLKYMLYKKIFCD